MFKIPRVPVPSKNKSDEARCSECGRNSAPYRCPTCRVKYCSDGCWQVHKEHCVPKPNSTTNHEAAAPVQRPVATNFPTKNTLRQEVFENLESQTNSRENCPSPSRTPCACTLLNYLGTVASAALEAATVAAIQDNTNQSNPPQKVTETRMTRSKTLAALKMQILKNPGRVVLKQIDTTGFTYQESRQDVTCLDSQAGVFDMKNKNGANRNEQMPGPTVPKPKTKGFVTTEPGLSAQNVKVDYQIVLKEVDMIDEMKEQKEAQAKVDASKRAESERLAEVFLKFSINGVCDSVLSEMQVIEQETPISSSSSKSKKQDSFFDDYEIVETSSERGSSLLSGLDGFSKSPMDWDIDRSSMKPKVMEDDEFIAALSGPSGPETKEPSSTSSASFGTEAQKKFGNAKAISSDQMFGDSRDNDYERRSNLSRFEGKSSISSADYFGTGDPRGGAGDSVGTPEEALQALRNPGRVVLRRIDISHFEFTEC